MQVAKTILNQLGGNKFLVMTGVQNLVADTNSLTMKLRSNTSKCKWLRITLNSSDLYDMEFINSKIVTAHKYEDVYSDMLARIFEKVTGYRTSL